MIYCASKFPTQRLADMLTNNKGRLKLAAREPIYQLVIREHEHSLYRVPQKTCDYIFYNNFNNKCPITIMFGTVSGKSMRHRKMVSFPTSPI